MILFHPTPPADSARQRTAGRSAMQWVVKLLLGLMAASFRCRPALRRGLRSDQGWIDFTAGIQAAIRFKAGRVSVLGGLPEDTDIVLVFRSDAAVRKFLTATPTAQVTMILQNDFYTLGNVSYLNLFVYCLSLLLSKQQIRQMEKERREARQDLLVGPTPCRGSGSTPACAISTIPIWLPTAWRISPG